MQIELNLDNHCVETEIRRIYNARVRSCLSGRGVTPQDEDVIELLKKLLETVDFPRLRSSLQVLTRDQVCRAVLVVDGKKPWIKIKNKRIGMDGKWQ